MKKARLIVSAIAVLTLLGGVFAFKSTKFNGMQAFTKATEYKIGDLVYTRAEPAYVPLNPARFVTNTGVSYMTVFRTFGTTSTSIITFTLEGGIQTITFPAYSAVQFGWTFTTAIN